MSLPFFGRVQYQQVYTRESLNVNDNFPLHIIFLFRGTILKHSCIFMFQVKNRGASPVAKPNTIFKVLIFSRYHFFLFYTPKVI